MPFDPDVVVLPGIFTTPEQWAKETLVIDHKLRAEKIRRMEAVVH